MTRLKKDILRTARMLAGALPVMALMAACSADDADGVKDPVSGGDLPIVLQSSMLQTRSSAEPHITTQGDNQVLVAGQNVDLFLDEDVAAGTTATYTGQLFYLQSTAPSGSAALGTGNFAFYSDASRSSAVTRYWPPSGNGLYFYAYYPAGAVSAPVTHTATSAQTFTVAADQSAADGSAAYDLMLGIPNGSPIGTATTNPVARPTASTMDGAAVNLHFRHCLSKVVVVLQGDGNGIGNGTSGGPETGEHAHANGYDQYGVDQFEGSAVTLGTASTGELYLQASVTPNSGAATALTTGTTGVYTLKTSSQTTLTNFCILPPQTLTGRKINLTLANGGTKSFTIPQEDTDGDGTPDADVVAEGGKVYTYTVTVGLYSVNVTATVGDWTPEDVTGGTLKF